MLFPQYLSFFVVLCPSLNLTFFLPLRVQSFVKRCNSCPLQKLFRYSLFVTSLVMLFPRYLSFFVVLCPLLNLTVFLPLQVQSFSKKCNNCPLHKLFRDSLFTSLIFFLDHSFLAPEGKNPRGVRDAFIELVSSLFTGRG